MTLVVGVDGWKGGWVAVQLRDGRFDGAFVDLRLATVVAHFARARIVSVDIPIGLPPPFPRRADIDAKAFLGKGGPSVFMTFPADAYRASSHADALAIARATCGKGLSQQSWRLGPRILEAAAIADDRIAEVHPECSFRALGGGKAFAGKKTWTGQAQRRRALATAGIIVPDVLGDAGRVPPDDILDAAVAAWSAARIANGHHGTLPVDPRPGEPSISY